MFIRPHLRTISALLLLLGLLAFVGFASVAFAGSSQFLPAISASEFDEEVDGEKIFDDALPARSALAICDEAPTFLAENLDFSALRNCGHSQFSPRAPPLLML